jgi:uncharacterized membrane protein
MKDTNIRSIVKTITWRITGSGATLLVSYFISNNWAIASTIAIAQLTLNTLLYYVHERLWSTTQWGILD